ncbi:MAG: NADH/ubiquinone/plastoquinone (complex I) [Candidatus Omnitrophica bacterium]|nr:NADH/ubiquinone/plastoquinone (complex I) [Candidatus Omnitrophota bacterium]
MTLVHYPLLTVFIPLFAAVLIPLLAWKRPHAAFGLALSGSLGSAACALAGLRYVLMNGPLSYAIASWAPPLGIEYVLDPIAGYVSSVIACVAAAVVLFTKARMLPRLGARAGAFYALVLLLIAGLLGIVITGDLFNLYVFLEISSLAAYALIALGSARSAFAAFRYLLLGTLAGSLYLLGVGQLYVLTGTLNMADMAMLLPGVWSSPVIQLGLILIVSGLCLKMALFPLHTWLPDAYSYAPTGISALISSTMSKVAAYALVRVLFWVFNAGHGNYCDPVLQVIAGLGAVAIVAGSVLAIAQQEYKRMLAYSSVAQVGYIAVGIGMANPWALTGALFHILAHAVAKALLFLVGGQAQGPETVLGPEEPDTLPIRSLTGLGKRQPMVAACFTVAALSMVGVPPLAGFFSKWYLVLGALHGRHWVLLIAILSSTLLNAVYFFRILERMYLHAGAREVSPEEIRPCESNAEGHTSADLKGRISSGDTSLPEALAITIPIVGLAIAVLAAGVLSSGIVSGVILKGIQGIL